MSDSLLPVAGEGLGRGDCVIYVVVVKQQTRRMAKAVNVPATCLPIYAEKLSMAGPIGDGYLRSAA